VTTLQDLEHAFEAKFAHDEEFRFLVGARRDKLFAQWASAMAGVPANRAAAVIGDVLTIPNGAGHDDAVIRHISGFLSAHGVTAADTNLKAALDRCAADARQHLLEHPPRQSDIL
jgi:hypothetical protein